MRGVYTWGGVCYRIVEQGESKRTYFAERFGIGFFDSKEEALGVGLTFLATENPVTAGWMGHTASVSMVENEKLQLWAAQLREGGLKS